MKKLNYANYYISTAPSAQNVVDIYKGYWLSKLPIEGVESGDRLHFEDIRIELWNNVVSVKGKTILELGPFEGFHACMLEELGAKSVTSIEANSLSYQKCLVVKDLFKLQANFMLGDYREYLKNCNEKYDIVLASGMLYHMIDPVELIFDIAKVTDVLFIWTHCYPKPGSEGLYKNKFDSEKPTLLHKKYKAYKHMYPQVDYHAGGGAKYAMWLTEESLLEALKDAGFNDIIYMGDGFDSDEGSVVLLTAKKQQKQLQ